MFTQFSGLEELKTNPPRIISWKVVGADQEGLQINIDCEVFNPSNVGIELPKIVFALAFKNVTIGKVFMLEN